MIKEEKILLSTHLNRDLLDRNTTGKNMSEYINLAKKKIR